MIYKIAKPMASLVLCVACATMLGCAAVSKTTLVASNDRAEQPDRKHELVRDYENRRNDVQFQAALSKFQQGDTRGAQRDIALLLERAPQHRAANLLASGIALEVKNPPLAIKRASRLIARDATDAEAHHTLGLAFDAEGRLADAKSHYRKAVELDPKNEIFAASWELANSENTRADTSAAQVFGVQLASYGERIDSAGALPAASPLAAGHQALAAGNSADAERQYVAAMSTAPQNPNIPREAAVQLLQHNQTDAAVRLLGHACRQFPKSVALLRTLATAQYRQGDYESSQVALQQALSLDNRDALSYFLLGAVREKLGDHGTAAQSPGKAHELRSATWAHP